MFRPIARMSKVLPWAAGSLIVTFVLAACGSAATGGAPQASASTATTSLTVSYSELVPDELAAWGASDAGLFKKNRLNVTLDYIPSANGVAALLSGQTQIANLGGSEVLSADAGGGDVVIVANLVPVYPYLLMVPADIQRASDLKGKKVGVSKFGSSSDVATRQVLQHEGLNPTTDVTIVQVGSAANRVSALKSGAIQGGLAQPPDTYTLQQQGLHALFDLAKLKLPAANTVVAVKRSYLQSHRSGVQAYVDSLVQSLAYERSHKKFTEDVLIKWEKLSGTTSLSPTYTFYMNEVFPKYPRPAAQNFEAAIRFEGTGSAKLASLKVASYLDPSLVQSASNRHLAG